MTGASANTTTALLRSAILGVLLLVLVGTEIELILLKHVADQWQLVPVILLPLTLFILAWHAMSRGTAPLRSLQVVMGLCLVAGGIGMIQHYDSNLIDAAESDPSLAGRGLYIEALQGPVPALAPGTLVQVALLGLAFAFRHPRLAANPLKE